MNEVATEIYLFQEGKGKYRIKPTKEKDKMVYEFKRYRSGSRLCKGKVLAPLTSIVLDGTHLLQSVFVCYCEILRSSKLERKKKERRNVFIIFARLWS